MSAPRVLIVDDEQPLARILSFALENEGFRVDVASDGIDAMNKVSTFAPDLILMDIMMPKLDGIETIRLLRQNELHRDMGICAISAKASPSTKEDALDAGADLFLRKPFQISNVIQQLESLLTARPNRG